MIPRSRLRATLLGVAAVLSAAVSLALVLTDVLRLLELHTVDARFELRGAAEPPRDVAVVAIDDKSFDEYGTYPFARRVHGEAIDALIEAGAATVAYDVQFTEQTTEEEDNALIEAVERAHGRIVLATTAVNEFGETEVLGGDATLRELGARAAHSRLVLDTDGISRRLLHSEQGLESFAVAAVEVATGRQVDRSRFDDAGTAWIDYAGPPGTIPTYSLVDVVGGRVDPARFRDRIVVVGASDPTLQDLHRTPTTGGDLMAGAELAANAISTVRRGFPLRELPTWLAGLVSMLLAATLPAAVLSAGLLRGLLVGAVVVVTYAIGVYLAFESGLILPVVAPAAGIAFALFAALALGYAFAAFERQRVRDVFARFVPAGVVDDVLARTDGDLRLGGKRLQATLVFCDVRGFTGFAERLPAEQVIEILNRYLDEMSEAIQEQEGTLVAYQGDGILAAFGAPIEQIDHADRALAAVREMAGARLERFNRWLAEQGIDEGFRIGIGVNSGMIMSGNVGSAWRVEYTAVGDTVNTASRLESMTKDTPHSILISDTTRAMLRREAPDLTYVDALTVRGKNVKANLWTLNAAA